MWTDFLSEDFDPERRPEYPWNRAPTREELDRYGGPMRDPSMQELLAARRSKRRRAASSSRSESSDAAAV